MREYQLIGEWPVPDRGAAIYELEAPNASPDALLSYAHDFGVEPDGARDVTRDLPDRLELTSGDQVFNVWKTSGALHQHDVRRWQIDDGSSSVPFSDEEAIERARAWMERYPLAGDSTWEPLRVARLNAGAATLTAEQLYVRVIDVAVVFQRSVDDLPVEGPGGKLTVYLDHDGELTGAERIARQLGGVRREVTEFRSPDSVLEEVQRFWGTDGPGRCEVELGRFGYFELGRSQYQELIEPVFVTSLRFIGRDDRVHTAEYPISAAAGPANPILRLSTFPPQEAPR